jgi:hypothetical protein
VPVDPESSVFARATVVLHEAGKERRERVDLVIMGQVLQAGTGQIPDKEDQMYVVTRDERLWEGASAREHRPPSKEQVAVALKGRSRDPHAAENLKCNTSSTG